jgi:NAD(P)-dependent dehydrogenase (short-subunit alcohol dehydrogenase family)
MSATPFSLSGRVALVTGANAGIGQGIAAALAAAGADIAAVGRSSPAETGERVRAAGRQFLAVEADLGSATHCQQIIQQVTAHFGSVDILVNNAGIIGPDSLDEHGPEEFDRVISIHLTGTFNTCKHAVPHMKKQGYGRIINTVSNAWNSPTGLVGYAAAKGGVTSLTWALAFELGPYGINVNAIAPFGKTRADGPGMAREKKKFEAGRMSQERLNKTPRDVDPSYSTPALLFLLTPEADEINGCVLRNGGGKISRFSHPQETKVVWRDYEKEGPWTVDQLRQILPSTLFAGSKKAPHL